MNVGVNVGVGVGVDVGMNVNEQTLLNINKAIPFLIKKIARFCTSYV
jgi:hypothetical protein